MSISKIVATTGIVNGVNTQFTTPTKFVAGTLRVVWNGQVYEQDDMRKGLTELTDQSFDTDFPPRVGDVIQVFYQEQGTDEILGVEGVKGSPFAPGECP